MRQMRKQQQHNQLQQYQSPTAGPSAGQLYQSQSSTILNSASQKNQTIKQTYLQNQFPDFHSCGATKYLNSQQQNSPNDTIVILQNNSSQKQLKLTPGFALRQTPKDNEDQFIHVVPSRNANNIPQSQSNPVMTQNSNKSDSVGSFAPQSKNTRYGGIINSKASANRRTRSKRLQSRSLIVVEVHTHNTTDSDQGGSNSGGKRNKSRRVIATITTPKFKNEDIHYHTHRANDNNNIKKQQSLNFTSSLSLLQSRKVNVGSKSLQQLNAQSTPKQQNSPNSAMGLNQGGSGIIENLKGSFATESCIKANRTAVKELRPPQNEGDGSNKSSTLSEPEISIGDDRNEELAFVPFEDSNREASGGRQYTPKNEEIPNQQLRDHVYHIITNLPNIQNVDNNRHLEVQTTEEAVEMMANDSSFNDRFEEEEKVESEKLPIQQQQQNNKAQTERNNRSNKLYSLMEFQEAAQDYQYSRPESTVSHQDVQFQQSPPRVVLIENPSEHDFNSPNQNSDLAHVQQREQSPPTPPIYQNSGSNSPDYNTTSKMQPLLNNKSGNSKKEGAHKRNKSSQSSIQLTEKRLTDGKNKYQQQESDTVVILSTEQARSPRHIGDIKNRSMGSNSCKKCIMCNKEIEDLSSHVHTPQVQPSPIRNQPQPLSNGSFQSSRNPNNNIQLSNGSIVFNISEAQTGSPSFNTNRVAEQKKNYSELICKSMGSSQKETATRGSFQRISQKINQRNKVKAPVITLNLGGMGTQQQKQRTPERSSIPFSVIDKPQLIQPEEQTARNSQMRQPSPRIISQQQTVKKDEISPIPSPRSSPYRTMLDNITYSHHQLAPVANQVLYTSNTALLQQSPPRINTQNPIQIGSFNSKQNGGSSNKKQQDIINGDSNKKNGSQKKTTSSNSPLRGSHIYRQTQEVSGQVASPNNNGGLLNQLTEAGSSLENLSTVQVNTNLETLIKYIAQQHQQQQNLNQLLTTTTPPQQYSSMDLSTQQAATVLIQPSSSQTSQDTTNNQTVLLQRQELLIEKAVTEYNKLLTRYNELLQKQAADRQLMHSQSLLIQSKDDAMRALNQRAIDLEKKVAMQAKELATVRQKAIEEKEQAFAEAHAHEKAKMQMATMVSALQDSEKDLKHKLNQAIQVQNENEQALKQYKESMLRLETEKKCLEIDLQRRYKHQGDPSSDDHIRSLKLENQELRMRLDETILGPSGIKVPQTIQPSAFAALSAVGYQQSIPYVPRRDSLVANNNNGGLQNQLAQRLENSQMMPQPNFPEEYLGRSPPRRSDAMMTESQAMSVPVEKYFAQQRNYEQNAPMPFMVLAGQQQQVRKPEVPLLNLRQINLNIDSSYNEMNNNSGRTAGQIQFKSAQTNSALNNNFFYNTTPAVLNGISQQSYGQLGNQQYGAIGPQVQSNRSNNHLRMQSPVSFDRKLQQNDSTSMSGVLNWPNKNLQGQAQFSNNQPQSSQSKVRANNRSTNFIPDHNEMPPAGVSSYISSINQNKMVYNVYNSTM